MTPKQFSLNAGFDNELSARHASRDLVFTLLDQLKARGYQHFEPTPKPLAPDIVWDVFAGCRIIVQWIPDWSLCAMAGLYECRIDTLATK